MADFLLEIGVEEIPDWMIEPALADLRARFYGGFRSIRRVGAMRRTQHRGA